MQTIILVDDEYYFRQAMKRYLSEWEEEYCLVGEAKNGKDGLELIRQLKPDIVLMDINMQIMSGLDAMQILSEEKIASKVILLTGYSEFEYAHKALRFGVADYLLKPIDKQELKKCLDQVTVQIEAERRNKELQIKYYSASFKVKEHFVNKIFSAKKESDWIEVEQMANDMLNAKDQFSYQAFLINIYSDEEENNKESELSFCFFSITNILIELFEQKQIQCFTDNNNTSLRGIVSANMSIDELEMAVLEVQQHSQTLIQQMLGYSLVISVGAARCHLREIEHSVQEACMVQKFMCMYRKNGVCTSAQLKFNEDRMGSFFGIKQNQLVLYIRTNNLSAMQALINEFFREMKENEVNPEIVLQRVGNILSCTYEIERMFWDGQSENTKNSSDGAAGLELVSRPKFEEDSIEQIQEKVLKYISGVMQIVNGCTTKKKSSLATNVAHYIEENYKRYELSLMDLSVFFGMSKTILCQQFKDVFSMTIGEYILQTRMIHAKEMLDEGYYNVTYVAEKCGYEDAGYFSKCFKKYFGISPKDYCETKSGSM